MKYTYSGLTGGTFSVGNSVTIGSGANHVAGVIVSDNGTNTAVIGSIVISGTGAGVGATIDNGSGVTATVTSVDPGDQPITLLGGQKFVITDVLCTNASLPLNTVANGEIWKLPNRSGFRIAKT